MDDSKVDTAKGRAKEAVGSLTDDDDLKREGRNDQRTGKVKDAIDRVGDKAKDAVDEIKQRST